MELPIEEYFTYHPPKTEERKEKHNKINEAALKAAIALNGLLTAQEDYYQHLRGLSAVVDEVVVDRHSRDIAHKAITTAIVEYGIENIQFARMMANQGITVDELKAEREAKE